jgi:hypothetical protein
VYRGVLYGPCHDVALEEGAVNDAKLAVGLRLHALVRAQPAHLGVVVRQRLRFVKEGRNLGQLGE